MNACLLPRKTLSKGLTLTETKASWKGVDLGLDQVSLPHPRLLAGPAEARAVPELAARVVVCVQNRKQTGAGWSQMWGLPGSLTAPGVPESEQPTRVPAFHQETWRLETQGVWWAPGPQNGLFKSQKMPGSLFSKTHNKTQVSLIHNSIRLLFSCSVMSDSLWLREL